VGLPGRECVAQKPRGGSPGPRSAGVYIGDVGLPVSAWPACRLRRPALVGQLPVGVLCIPWFLCWTWQYPFSLEDSNCLVSAIWCDQRPIYVSGGSCVLCYSCHKFLVPSICWEFCEGHLVLTGSLRFTGVAWIPIGGCLPEWADFVSGWWWWCGLGRLQHSWCGFGTIEVRGGSRWDDGCMQALGLSIDTVFSKGVQESGLPVDWVAQKPCRGSPGPWSASDRMASLQTEMACSGCVVTCGGLWIPRILCWTWQYRFSLRDEYSLGWATWSDQRPVHVGGGSCALCYSCDKFFSTQYCWNFLGMADGPMLWPKPLGGTGGYTRIIAEMITTDENHWCGWINGPLIYAIW